jgi:hypothetical protein
MLGLRSWALLDGRVYLADTSSLTRDFDLARQNLRSEALDIAAARAEKTMSTQTATNSIAEYVRCIRREIDEDRFVDVWGRGLDTVSLGHAEADVDTQSDIRSGVE